MWDIIDNNLVNLENTREIPELLTEPYPLKMWYVDNGRITNSLIPEQVDTLIEPYPVKMWRVDETGLTTGLIPKMETLGAFAHAKYLNNVEIDYHTIYFGDFAFNGAISLGSIDINILSEFNEETTFYSNTDVNFKDIYYFLSNSLDNLGTDNISFGTIDDMTETDEYVTGALPKHRVREPNNTI